MDNIYWNGSNKVYRNAGGDVFQAIDAELHNCCCDECPTDCDSCPTTYVVSGEADNPLDFCFVGVKCDYVNRDVVVTRSGCGWSGTAGSISCVDIGGTLYWLAKVGDGSCELQAGAPLLGNPCPPIGGVGVWTDASGGICTGQISVA